MERAFGNLDAVHVCFTMFTSTLLLQSNDVMVLKDTGTNGESRAEGESRVKWTVKPMRPWDARYASWSLQESRVSRGCLQKVYRTQITKTPYFINCLNDQVNIVSVVWHHFASDLLSAKRLWLAWPLLLSHSQCKKSGKPATFEHSLQNHVNWWSETSFPSAGPHGMVGISGTMYTLGAPLRTNRDYVSQASQPLEIPSPGEQPNLPKPFMW